MAGLTDFDLTTYAAATYGHPSGPTVEWDRKAVTAGICWFLKYVDGGTVLAFEGTHDVPDWLRDFAALPVIARGLGLVHPGFYDGIPEVWAVVKPLVVDKLYVCGHSLGAARAALLSAVAAADGVIPARRVGIGEPRSGGKALSEILKSVPSASYKAVSKRDFRVDYVTCVPLALPGFSYQHPTIVTNLPVAITAEADAAYGVCIAAHYPAGYLSALSQGQATAPHF